MDRHNESGDEEPNHEIQNPLHDLNTSSILHEEDFHAKEMDVQELNNYDKEFLPLNSSICFNNTERIY